MRQRQLVLALMAILAAGLGASEISLRDDAGSWPQWGGPGRDFVVTATGLADSWPAAGPKRLWSRPLGEGHSAIAVADGVLYTAYRPLDLASFVRRRQEETVIALDAGSGRTLWEHTYPAPTSGMNFEFGAGPHATPLVTDRLVIAAGSNQQIVALDRKTGRVAWSHDLPKEFGSTPLDRGYASSPLLFKGLVIVPAGGQGSAVVAFRIADGTLAWKNQSFKPSPASPLVINVDGQEQLIVLTTEGVAAVDPANGDLLWQHPHKTDYGLNITTPVFGPANQLFISSAYNSGSRLLQLSQAGGKTAVKEIWFTNRLRLHFGNAVRLGDRYYGSSGDFGPAFVTAVDAATGKVVWQDRGFARGWLLWTGDRFIVLDEDGALGLARPTPKGLEVMAKAQVLSSRAWTAPTLVGTKVYARDRKNIVALELGR